MSTQSLNQLDNRIKQVKIRDLVDMNLLSQKQEIKQEIENKPEPEKPKEKLEDKTIKELEELVNKTNDSLDSKAKNQEEKIKKAALIAVAHHIELEKAEASKALNSANAFASLHDALIDDCTLAARIKGSGARTWIGLSHAARSHRGYQKLQPIWEMVARTAYTQLNYSPILLAFCTITMVAMFWLAPFAFLLLLSQVGFIISVIVWLTMLWTYYPVLTYYRCTPFWVALLPVIGALYLSMTWTSALRYWRGERARWKDRQYESNTH